MKKWKTWVDFLTWGDDNTVRMEEPEEEVWLTSWMSRMLGIKD